MPVHPVMQLRRLEPSFREKIWGATRLEPWFPNSAPKIGEVWFEGAPELPLVKFLFTTDKLSVQVHPDDAYARQHHGSPGKTEMWHILAAEPGARIAAGFRGPLTPEQVRAAAVSGEIEGLLQWFEARAGDTFFIPAGTVHAIGAGLALCEIQQNSDVTYRLYDYGRPRELHLDQALAVSLLGPHAARPQPLENVLVSCRHFATECVGANRSIEYQPFADRAQLLIAIEGVGEIAGQPIRAGEVWHVSSASDSFQISGNLRFLRVSVPPA
jgi:mannose-6-phosphate isomerase